MTKQEALKAGVQDWIDNSFGVPNTFNIQVLFDFMGYLSERGAVLALDDELPVPFDIEDNVLDAVDYIKKLKGFEKVVSLIEVG